MNNKMFDGTPRMFLDQYGRAVWAKSRKELQALVKGKLNKMYVDKKNGGYAHVGYVSADRWFHAFAPVEVSK